MVSSIHRSAAPRIMHYTRYALTLALLASAACRSKDAARGDGPYADVVAKTVPAIEQSIGLRFKQPPKLEMRSKAQVREFLLKAITDTAAQRELKGSERAYKIFGMLPDTLDLEKLLVDVLSEQVVGYYEPKTKVLYVVEGAPKEMAELTVAHELVHALQDQYVDLDSLQRSTGDSDRKMAAQAVFEGQAMYEQLVASGLPINIPGGWDRVRTIIRDSQTGMPIFASAPFLIQESLLFPYLNGAEFIRNFRDRTGKGSPFSDLPHSTEQILHPEAYFGGAEQKRDEPTRVSFQPINGATVTYDDNLGEFTTRILLYDRIKVPDAINAARGWDGDRFITFTAANVPADKQGLAWASVWDTPQDATFFQGFLQRLADDLNVAKPGRIRRITAGTVGGRAVVLYVDVPAGGDPQLVPLSSVTLEGGN